MVQKAREILQQYWGYPEFRPLQEEIIASVLEGKDTLALMPTGGGKSICFQVPALYQEGICLVISPLIALMKDQVHQLLERNVPAAAIHSGMHYNEIDRTLDNCIYGNVKLLYLSPERLMTDLAIERINKMKVNLIAVDEAHCISQWGYDFRPPYLEIARLRDRIPNVPILAVTATATKTVVEDIQEKLEFKKPNVFQKSFKRDNLAYVVLDEEGKREKLLEIVKNVKGTGIVYVRNRRKTKEVAFFLQQKGVAADFYHAGLDADTRSKKQDLWLANKIRVMICTNAFGMGIDKPDVRSVVHLELPDSLEGYFQEAGRAGRDGKKSYAVLLYNDSDRKRLERNFESSFPSFDEIRRVYRALGSYFQLATGGGTGASFDFDILQFTQNFQLDLMKTFSALKILEKSGWLVLTESIFVPSSLKILVEKDELYDYQLKNAKLDPLLKIILRTYQGAFHHHIHIREQQLAKFLKTSVSNLEKSLSKLHQDSIIDYKPKKDKPQIIFIKDRVDADNLLIDQKLYKFRKEQQKMRIQEAVRYATTPKCRSQQLLAYFNETDSNACGICDVCLGRTETELSTDAYEQLKKKIERILRKESLTLNELIESFGIKRENQVLKTMEYLLDEGFVEKEGEQFRWKK